MDKCKRTLDIVLTLAAGLIALPVLVLVALAVWAAMGRPILFRQQRPGLGGKPFWMLKFRTMNGADAGPGHDQLRLTRLGRWLRDCSLDELPQLWNVLVGEMSLVGPRPQLMRYLDRYSSNHLRRHEVLPGITGLAQVSGRNAILWETRLDLDVWYVDHRSFWLDLKILARTIPAVLTARGVRAPGLATMSEYLGPQEPADHAASQTGPTAARLAGGAVQSGALGGLTENPDPPAQVRRRKGRQGVIMPSTHQPLAAVLAAALALAGASCGGGGSTGGTGTAGGLGMLITDGPTDGLSVFTLDLVSVQLMRADGTLTDNLLPAPRNYDVLSLAGTRALLGHADPPEDTYTGIRVSVDPASVLAYDMTGTAVSVTVTRSTADASFLVFDATDLAVGDAFEDMLMDIDLGKSLSDDPVNLGGLIFELVVNVEHEFEDSDMDEFRGQVVSEDPSSSRFVVELLDDSGSDSFGQVTVTVDAGDELLGDDEQTFGSVADFFEVLQPGSEVELNGSFAGSGAVNATRVEIEDSLSFPVKIKGDLLSVNSATQEFTLLWKDIRRGSSLVLPVLAQIGDPRVLDLAWDASTIFTLEDGSPSTQASLVPGTEIYVHFLDFAGPMPFLAAGVEFDEDGAEIEGTITDITGLPGSFVMEVDSDGPLWSSGSVTGPVTVTLAGVSRLWLDTESEPSLQPGDLLVGLEIEIHGALTGPPEAATIAATKLKVEPGALEGTLQSVNTGTGTITVEVSNVEDPFGGVDPAGIITIQVPAGAWIEGDDGLLTLADLASMLAGLGAGESVEIELEGVQDGFGQIIAWEMEAEVGG